MVTIIKQHCNLCVASVFIRFAFFYVHGMLNEMILWENSSTMAVMVTQPRWHAKCSGAMQMFCIDTLSFYCAANACIVTKRKKGLQIFIPYESSFSLVFREEWLVGATPSTWNFGSTGPRWSEIADSEMIFARSASAVTPSGKSSINTNRKFTTHFSMSLRWSSYVAPKPPKGEGAQKRKTANFYLKLHFAWRKSATKFLCVKTVGGNVVRHSLA